MSEHLQAYVDSLLQHPDLFRSDGAFNSRFAQERSDLVLIGGLVRDEDSFLALQENARRADVNYTWASSDAIAGSIARANGFPDIPAHDRDKREALLDEQVSQQLASADTVYLSNINYDPKEQMKLAQSISSSWNWEGFALYG